MPNNMCDNCEYHHTSDPEWACHFRFKPVDVCPQFKPLRRESLDRIAELEAERDRLMEFVKDALPQLKVAGQYLITADMPYTGSGLLDLAARAEAILEEK